MRRCATLLAAALLAGCSSDPTGPPPGEMCVLEVPEWLEGHHASFTGNVGVAGSFYATHVQAEHFALDGRVIGIERITIGGRTFGVLVAR